MGTAEDGFGLILIEFVFEKPLAEATQDIRDAISEIRVDLPDEMKEPIIKKLNDTDRPIVSLALNSTRLSPAELTRLADPAITRELRSIPGVAEVAVSGKLERELTVELRPADLQAAGVSVAQVVQALQLQNLASPVGRVEGAFEERSIRLKGRLAGPSEFEQLVVAERNGTLIRLGRSRTCATAPRSSGRSRCSTAARRSASTSRSRRATAPPRWRARSSSGWSARAHAARRRPRWRWSGTPAPG